MPCGPWLGPPRGARMGGSGEAVVGEVQNLGDAQQQREPDPGVAHVVLPTVTACGPRVAHRRARAIGENTQSATYMVRDVANGGRHPGLERGPAAEPPPTRLARHPGAPRPAHHGGSWRRHRRSCTSPGRTVPDRAPLASSRPTPHRDHASLKPLTARPWPLGEWCRGIWPRSLRKTRWRTTATHCYFPEAVRENEEVVPVNEESTWVLLSGVTVGR